MKESQITKEPSNKVKVKKYLLTNGKITSSEARKKIKVDRLSEYIRILRKEGMDIKLVWKVRSGKRTGVYMIERTINEAIDHVKEIEVIDSKAVKIEKGARLVQEGDFMEIEKTSHSAIITSLPDFEETNLESLEDWKLWIWDVCEKLSSELDEKGVIFFYQTDRKYKGTLIDKKNIITNVFIKNGFSKILSKIVLKQEPETISLFRPSFTNLFAFSKKTKGGKVTPDVFPAGEMAYRNAMGNNAIDFCLDYIEKYIKTDVIYNPFCGSGSVLKRANDRGLNAIGIEIDPDQVIKSREI